MHKINLFNYTPRKKAILWIAFSISVYLWIDYKANFDYQKFFTTTELSEIIISLFIMALISLVGGFIVLLIFNKIVSVLSIASIKVKKIHNQRKTIKKNFNQIIKDSGGYIAISFLYGIANCLLFIGVPLLIVDNLFGTNLTNSFESIIFSGTEIQRIFKVFLLGVPQALYYGWIHDWELPIGNSKEE